MSNAPHGTDPGPEDETEPTPCAYTEYEDGEAISNLPATGEAATGVEARIWDALYGVEDPEMPVSIVNLGLIYGIEIEDGHATIEMTLTYTGCPARSMLTENVESTAESVEGVDSAEVRLVWSPEWTLELVTEDGREALRDFGVSI